MKVKFSREITYFPEWNGNRTLPAEDQIKAIIKPMKVGDLLTVMDAMGTKPGEEVDRNSMDLTRLFTETAHILPKYVTVAGLEDEQGPVTIEDMLNFGHYVPLATELLMECARASMPSDNTEGNSPPQSA
jgi:hypothetical protein